MVSIVLTDSSGAESEPYIITIVVEDDPEPVEQEIVYDF